MNQLIAQVPNMRGGLLSIYQEEDTVIIGGRQLDLDGIGQLQVALDDAVTAIREYEAGRDA